LAPEYATEPHEIERLFQTSRNWADQKYQDLRLILSASPDPKLDELARTTVLDRRVSLEEHQSVDRIRRNDTEARLRLAASAFDQAAMASMAGRFAWAHARPSPAPSAARVMQ